ncbi:MAG: sugar phosphate isomerase/epimerase [Clostridiales bacterium]|nr:sugar phosphate isomerase/epimerase [Clostridiales bacterium]
MRIGAQMFTTRDTCQTLEGFADTLKRIADIGYEYVQVSGTCPFEAEWLKEQLAKNGLTCVLTHTPVPRLTGETDKVLSDHRIFGCHNIGLGYWSFDPEQDMSLEKWLSTFVPVAKAIREGGAYFMYHNHHNEFKRIGGKLIMETLMEALTPEEMGFTLDTYWVQTAGGDPALWLEKLAGRIPCIHLKDHGFDHSMQAVGEGNINFDRVFAKAEAGGTEYMLVEQDNCNGEDPLECLKRSYLYLKACGFH